MKTLWVWQDLALANALVVNSMNKLCEARGFPPMGAISPPVFQTFWIAQDDDRIVGFSFAWAAGDLWFLSQLFISPDHQGLGGGDTLLNMSREHARLRGANVRALITCAFNPVRLRDTAVTGMGGDASARLC